MGKQEAIQRNNSVYIRMFFLSLLGSGTLVFYYMIEMGTGSFVWLTLLSFGIVLFLAVLFTAAKKLLKRTPALELRDDGLVDEISLASAGLIPWKAISAVKYEEYLNQKQILIILRDSQPIIDNLPFFKKKMVNQQFVDTGAVIVVNPKMIKAKPDDLVKKIKRRARV